MTLWGLTQPGGRSDNSVGLGQSRVQRGWIGLGVKLGQSTVDRPGRLPGAAYLRTITIHRAGVERPGAQARREQAPPGRAKRKPRQTQNRQPPRASQDQPQQATRVNRHARSRRSSELLRFSFTSNLTKTQMAQIMVHGRSSRSS